MASDRSVADSFWNSVVKSDGCWTWLGQISQWGYGRIERVLFGRKQVFLAHRVSWVIHHGDIPGNLQVLHTCDSTTCVNPAHLFLGTPKDNSDDKVKKGRQSKGERFSSSKLKSESVLEIRKRYSLGGITQQALADEYGVAISQINEVVNLKGWKHVAGPIEPRNPRQWFKISPEGARQS